jgi:hypothetical protein|tara:strand:+ start:365 stop:937 length:573 start_codon:yes stop_codon:yes gene_type:complete
MDKLQISNSKKIQDWPLDWFVHIQKTCEFCFDGEDEPSLLDSTPFFNFVVTSQQSLAELRKYLDLTGIELRLIFKMGQYDYGSSVRYLGEEKVQFSVYYVHKIMLSIDEVEDSVELIDKEIEQATHSLLLIQSLVKSQSKSAYNCVQKIKKVIIQDFKNREDGGDSHDFKDDPILPKAPALSPSPKLINS